MESNQVHDTVKPLIIKNGLELYPVSVHDTGTGLPYAPQNWPNLGDKWFWKAGIRITKTVYYHDRYLYPPKRLVEEHGSANMYKSKIAVAQFLNSQFPGEDVNAFFSAFSWQIASHQLYNKSGDANVVEDTSCGGKLDTTNCKEVLVSLGAVAGENSTIGCCKAKNEACKRFVKEGSSSSVLLPCDICCIEPSFCRMCCCIICCQSISIDTQTLEFIRCNAKTNGDYICGHIAHIECAIGASLAGTLEGNNGLDAEYYCLCCDSKTDLVSYVMNLVHSGKTISTRGCKGEEVLSVWIRLLGGSKRQNALQLSHDIQAKETKLKGGTHLKGMTQLKEVWGKEDTFSVNMEDTFTNVKSAPRFVIQEDHLNTNRESRRNRSTIEAAVVEILINLIDYKEDEYKLADERLLVQTCRIQNTNQVINNDDGEREDPIKQEVVKLEGVKEEVSNDDTKMEDHIKQEVVKLEGMNEEGE